MLNTINPQNLIFAREHWIALAPYLIMVGGALAGMLLATVRFGSEENPMRQPLYTFALLVLVAAGAVSSIHWVKEPINLFGGMMRLDYFSSLFNIIICASTILVLFTSYSYLNKSRIHYTEFYPLILVSTLGMMLLAAANELLTIFVSLELMSLTVYVLVGLKRSNALSNEASIKYFVMGGAGSAILLYGISFIYGALGTTKLTQIAAMFAQADAAQALANPILVVGVVLLLVGFLFKVAVAPFHMWTPDVYEGAPLNVTAYMATTLKAAVFASLIRVSVSVFGDQGLKLFGDLQPLLHAILWWLCLATMLVGNLVALMQTDLKRLMAYSAIAHTGYLLIGILAGPQTGYSGIIFYLITYAAMNIGLFATLTLFSSENDKDLSISSLSGFAKSHPVVAAVLTVFLLSLSGIPPTAGFVGKYYLFSNALEAGETLLVLVGVFTSAISVYYYLRLVVLMYMSEPGTERATTSKGLYMVYLAMAICLLLTLNYGIFPGQLIHSVKKAAIF